jgi:hypothetical protein
MENKGVMINMSDKISWLLLEYDKTHNQSGLVVSGTFSGQFVEWVIDHTIKEFNTLVPCPACGGKLELVPYCKACHSDWDLKFK